MKVFSLESFPLYSTRITVIPIRSLSHCINPSFLRLEHIHVTRVQAAVACNINMHVVFTNFSTYYARLCIWAKRTWPDHNWGVRGFPCGKIIIIMLLSPSLPPLTSQHFGQDFNTEKSLSLNERNCVWVWVYNLLSCLTTRTYKSLTIYIITLN